MSDVRDKYVELLQGVNIEQPNYHTEKIKKRTSKFFGDEIAFWHPKFRCESEMIFSDIVPKGIFVEAGASARTEQHDVENLDDVGIQLQDKPDTVRRVCLAAQLIKSEVQTVQDMPWPSSPGIKSEQSINALISVVLFNLLAWIIVGIDEVFCGTTLYRKKSVCSKHSGETNTCYCTRHHVL